MLDLFAYPVAPYTTYDVIYNTPLTVVISNFENIGFSWPQDVQTQAKPAVLYETVGY